MSRNLTTDGEIYHDSQLSKQMIEMIEMIVLSTLQLTFECIVLIHLEWRMFQLLHDIHLDRCSKKINRNFAVPLTRWREIRVRCANDDAGVQSRSAEGYYCYSYRRFYYFAQVYKVKAIRNHGRRQRSYKPKWLW